MSKNQIIAKGVICGLGFYAVGYCLSSMSMTWMFRDNAWNIGLNVFVYSAVLFIICRVLIFGSDGLSAKISGSYEGDEDFDRAAYLVKCFRISFVIVGLSILCSWRTIHYLSRFFQSLSLPNIRLWFRNLIQTGDLGVSAAWLIGLIPLLKILLGVYLLCGGAFIINRHLKRSGLKITKELSNG